MWPKLCWRIEGAARHQESGYRHDGVSLPFHLQYCWLCITKLIRCVKYLPSTWWIVFNGEHLFKTRSSMKRVYPVPLVPILKWRVSGKSKLFNIIHNLFLHQGYFEKCWWYSICCFSWGKWGEYTSIINLGYEGQNILSLIHLNFDA